MTKQENKQLLQSNVLFEQSPSELRSDTDHYIHFRRMKTDTGIELDSTVTIHSRFTLDRNPGALSCES
jgi:hypothetical protein